MHYLQYLQLLSRNPNIDKQTYQQFVDFINSTDKLSRDTNIPYHLCSFFVPYDPVKKSIFMGHHIKSDSWIPPGGHIDEGDTPLETVIREYEEELGVKLIDETIELFDLSIIDINKPQSTCKRHYDIWHLVHTTEQNYGYDKGEFLEAKWIPLDDAPAKMRVPEFQEVIERLKSHMH
ncbi:MAG: NUDIX domain-containing protein [Weeksellaceae bacterium]